MRKRDPPKCSLESHRCLTDKAHFLQGRVHARGPGRQPACCRNPVPTWAPGARAAGGSSLVRLTAQPQTCPSERAATAAGRKASLAFRSRGGTHLSAPQDVKTCKTPPRPRGLLSPATPAAPRPPGPCALRAKRRSAPRPPPSSTPRPHFGLTAAIGSARGQGAGPAIPLERASGHAASYWLSCHFGGGTFPSHWRRTAQDPSPTA